MTWFHCVRHAPYTNSFYLYQNPLLVLLGSTVVDKDNRMSSTQFQSFIWEGEPIHPQPTMADILMES